MIAAPALPRTTHGMLRMALVLALLLARLMAPQPAFSHTQADSDQSALIALLEEGAICHASGSEQDTPEPGHDKHPSGNSHECGLCPACHLLGTQALPVATSVFCSPLLQAATADFTRPRSTAPPADTWTPSHPRAPPALPV